ncbi:MAG: hypothetical protein HYX47_16415 [Burkholderiales bacterium]|nr:hypothetical protein [Burkholderiales bacterium]
MNQPTAPAEPVDLAGESVAGEEDPGASIDLALATGEQRCHTCGGTGMLNGAACPDCEGTGKVITGIESH